MIDSVNCSGIYVRHKFFSGGLESMFIVATQPLKCVRVMWFYGFVFASARGALFYSTRASRSFQDVLNHCFQKAGNDRVVLRLINI